MAELEARIAEHAREAHQQIAHAKRPDQPPPEAEEEQPEQPEAGAPESGPVPTPQDPRRKARPHGRAPLPGHLPGRRIEHPVDPESTTCPHCPGHPPLVKIGEDVREKLHKLPVQYEPVVRELSLAHVACMAHIRRKIFEAREDAHVAADLLLAAIQRLNRIERLAKEQGLSAAQRLEVRQREARPLFEDLEKLLELNAKDVLPRSPLGKAVSYARNQWAAMGRYLEVAEAELDNNSIEHALRGVVMGRRNWLHVGQEVGGERAANLFSLIITCQRLGVEPYAYLCDIVPRLGRHPQRDIGQLTPRGWMESRSPSSSPTDPGG